MYKDFCRVKDIRDIFRWSNSDTLPKGEMETMMTLILERIIWHKWPPWNQNKLPVNKASSLFLFFVLIYIWTV